MADVIDSAVVAETDEARSPGPAPEKEKAERREIKGGIPYTPAPGVLKKALELIIAAERPDKFSTNYMATVLKLSGGAARAVPPFLKKMQFIAPDATPTLLYSRFKTESGRSQAAYDGLKNAFGELFRRNEYIHKADESSVKDTIVEITGLKKNDAIVRLMYASFQAIRGFISGEVAPRPLDGNRVEAAEDNAVTAEARTDGVIASAPSFGLGLSYQINIVLPETENVGVFNAIFRSLRDNLLR